MFDSLTFPPGLNAEAFLAEYWQRRPLLLRGGLPGFRCPLPADELAVLRNRTIGFVFQGFNLLPRMTLEDNVALPLVYSGIERAARREKGRQMLARVGLDGYALSLPARISGGQQQRVAIARALINSPRLILADEPTGNLDSHTSEEIMALFEQLNAEGITIVLVTHEADIAAHARRQVRFLDGFIVSDTATPVSELQPC
jgi:putative ABC transport system ATP-binding protein